MKFLLVPHEPTNFEINRLIKIFKDYGEKLLVSKSWNSKKFHKKINLL